MPQPLQPAPAWRGFLRIATVLMVAALTAGGASAEYQVRSFIQPDRDVSETETVRFVVQIEGGGNSQIAAPRLGKLQNLKIVGGPDRRFDSVWRNGRFSSTAQFIYTLLPEREGRAKIPGLELEIEGESYRTDPIEFGVTKAAAGVPPPRPKQQQPGSDGSSSSQADVFIRAALGSDEVWLGEAVALTVSVFTAERISNPSLSEQPSLSRFWVEDVELDPEAESFQQTIEGRRYVVYPMVRKILVPQTPGDVEIDSYVMQIPIRRRSGSDPFEFFSMGRNQNVMRKTQPLTLKVRALPRAGRPDTFSGAVGSFTMKVALDRTESQVNDAVSLKATVEGEGFLRAVVPPLLDAPPDLKVFDPKISSTSRAVRGKLVSRKTWEWILVPLAPGELKIPELEFHYFDPATDRYEVARKQPQLVVVRRGEEAVDGPVARGDIRLERRDLAFIKPLRGELRQGSVRAHRSDVFVTLAVLPLAWVPLFILVGRRRASLQRNVGLIRARKARTRAKKRLASVRRSGAGDDSATFHEQVARALVEYVADRFDRSAAGMTYEQADQLLGSRGIATELRERFRTCLETCDFARFVPASSAPERRAEILEEAAELVDKIESTW